MKSSFRKSNKWLSFLEMYNNGVTGDVIFTGNVIPWALRRKPTCLRKRFHNISKRSQCFFAPTFNYSYCFASCLSNLLENNRMELTTSLTSKQLILLFSPYFHFSSLTPVVADQYLNTHWATVAVNMME